MTPGMGSACCTGISSREMAKSPAFCARRAALIPASGRCCTFIFAHFS